MTAVAASPSPAPVVSARPCGHVHGSGHAQAQPPTSVTVRSVHAPAQKPQHEQAQAQAQQQQQQYSPTRSPQHPSPQQTARGPGAGVAAHAQAQAQAPVPPEAAPTVPWHDDDELMATLDDPPPSLSPVASPMTGPVAVASAAALPSSDASLPPPAASAPVVTSSASPAKKHKPWSPRFDSLAVIEDMVGLVEHVAATARRGEAVHGFLGDVQTDVAIAANALQVASECLAAAAKAPLDDTARRADVAANALYAALGRATVYRKRARRDE